MSQAIDIIYKGCASRFSMKSIDRKCLHGFTQRVALDEKGNECSSVLLTRDVGFLLPAGSTTDTYLDVHGDTVKKSELVAVDSDGKPLRTLLATVERSQTIEGPIAMEEFLGHVVTKVYMLEAEALDLVLHKALSAGAIFRVPFRPRPTHTETPAFLLSSEHGVFLAQAEPCGFEFVGLEHAMSDADGEYEDTDVESDEFSFNLDWEADHAAA